jgi:hypothetical protein
MSDLAVGDLVRSKHSNRMGIIIKPLNGYYRGITLERDYYIIRWFSEDKNFLMPKETISKINYSCWLEKLS